jgi:Ni/Fe-hydrogenase subunit HybB-like protein
MITTTKKNTRVKMVPKSNEYVIHRSKILTPSFWVLLAFTLLGFFCVGVRYVKGIGAVSNLSDGFPWGLWIAYDVATGTALACGGYAMAIVIYIMNGWKYHPLIRSAIVTSVFGYALAGFSVMVDLGRYWNAYSFFIPSRWQTNSVMFEVALCVMTYTMVLIIELLPAILERLAHSEQPRFGKLKNLARRVYPKLDKVLIFFIVLGITLPTMHQSSLGSMMIIAGSKLHPIWQTGFLPLLFLINAMYIGYSVVIFESTLASVTFHRPFEKEIRIVAKVVPYLTAAWLIIRFADLYHRGYLADAFSGGYYSKMFLTETFLIAGGAYMLTWEKFRMSPRWVFVSAVMLCLGGSWYRFSVYIIGFNPGKGWSYFPSLPEFFITLGMVAFEILGYMVLVKLFPIMPNVNGHTHKAG